jgi:hypothetical protein
MQVINRLFYVMPIYNLFDIDWFFFMIFIFVWRLLGNWLPTKTNMVTRCRGEGLHSHGVANATPKEK